MDLNRPSLSWTWYFPWIPAAIDLFLAGIFFFKRTLPVNLN